jgi:hypothetical protein
MVDNSLNAKRLEYLVDSYYHMVSSSKKELPKEFLDELNNISRRVAQFGKDPFEVDDIFMRFFMHYNDIKDCCDIKQYVRSGLKIFSLSKDVATDYFKYMPKLIVLGKYPYDSLVKNLPALLQKNGYSAGVLADIINLSIEKPETVEYFMDVVKKRKEDMPTYATHAFFIENGVNIMMFDESKFDTYNADLDFMIKNGLGHTFVCQIPDLLLADKGAYDSFLRNIKSLVGKLDKNTLETFMFHGISLQQLNPKMMDVYISDGLKMYKKKTSR